MWYVSLDYINHQTSLTADQARIDPDGRMRFVISERDPGVANWLERTGHRRGYVQLRWQRLARDLGPEDGPQVAVVPFGDLASRLPYYEQRPGDAAGVAGPDRRAPGRGRGKDAGLMMLQDKVVVVAGVGPGLGRSIALASAREGRGRGAGRAHRVAAGRRGQGGRRAGRRALAVPTDLADAAAAEHLADAAHDGVRPGRRAGLQRAGDAADQGPGRGAAWTRSAPASTPTSSPRCG